MAVAWVVWGVCGVVLAAIFAKNRSNVYNLESKAFILLTWKANSINFD